MDQVNHHMMYMAHGYDIDINISVFMKHSLYHQMWNKHKSNTCVHGDLTGNLRTCADLDKVEDVDLGVSTNIG
jgi:hypothetical protein